VSGDRWLTDWPPSERFPVYTLAHAGEARAEPSSPLGWTLGWEQAMVPGWRDAYLHHGLLPEQDLPEHQPPLCGSFGSYLYLNQACAETVAARLPGSSAEAWVLSAEDFPEIAEQRRRADAARRSRTDLTYLTPAELVERARGLLPLLRETFAGHAAAAVWAPIGPGMVQALTAPLGEDVGPLHLVAGLGDLDCAGAALAVWDLSRMVAGSSDLTLYFDGGVPGILDRLEGSPSDDAKAFLDAFGTLLYEYGSRGPGEWDLRSDVWETRPELVLTQLERVRFVPDRQDPRRRHQALAAEREAAVARVSQRLAGDPEAALTFAAAVRASRLFLGARERARTNAVKVVNEIRVAIREVGRQMADAHHLAGAELVMMLTADELDDFVAHPETYGLKLAERAREHAALADLEPPSCVGGAVPPLSQWSPRSEAGAEPGQGGDVLQGAPGAAGVATGRARVVRHVLDATAFEPGDILVAPAGDPSWTPLFLVAAAVVLDTGTTHSHAVFVSRELGIPCVPSAPGATRRIPDGALVRVDGHAGTVTLL
jgi:pyruvate,water dikinase